MVDIKELRIGNWVTCNYPVGIENDIVLIVDGRDECILVRGNYLWVKKSILSPIPLTPAILSKCGFRGEIWVKKSLGLEMTGPDGFHDLILGMPVDNSYCAPMIKMGTGDGFTIQHAAEIQKDWAENHPGDPPVKDESFTPMKMGDTICLRPIKYLHQLQNLYFSLTGEELEINL